MRKLVCLALVSTLITNVPSLCAHTMFVESPVEPTAHTTELASHAPCHHASQSKLSRDQAHHKTSDEQADHCPDGCKGGANCKSCSTAPAAIVADADLSFDSSPGTSQVVAIKPALQLPFIVDPPPPKRRS